MNDMTNEQQRSFVALVQRSRDVGDGWRKVNPNLWRLVEQAADDLVEKDKANLRVRLKPGAELVLKYGGADA